MRASPAVQAGRVLVIDDEAAVGRTIQRLLGEQYEVVVLTAGKDAIDLLVGKEADFDLILCDLTMPDVTGMDVYTRASKLAPTSATVLSS